MYLYRNYLTCISHCTAVYCTTCHLITSYRRATQVYSRLYCIKVNLNHNRLPIRNWSHYSVILSLHPIWLVQESKFVSKLTFLAIPIRFAVSCFATAHQLRTFTVGQSVELLYRFVSHFQVLHCIAYVHLNC